MNGQYSRFCARTALTESERNSNIYLLLNKLYKISFYELSFVFKLYLFFYRVTNITIYNIVIYGALLNLIAYTEPYMLYTNMQRNIFFISFLCNNILSLCIGSYIIL